MRTLVRRRPVALAISVLLFALWTLWVWYAKYLHCDDLLRDQGGVELRLADGELARCTVPGFPFAVYETMWAFGLAASVVAIVIVARAKPTAPRNIDPPS
ncbi:MAG: hypothetical protein HKN74_10730 [Acidimicrobiia bacterium]|nr:hypothetical protein [Acidimicrobiia bacterium]MBT8216007.1 hypothetical protein [Acidimicrobiia bacterium]NNF10750.1 hypothetical protein [Acidimicrobiia bacterium]NNL69221.1 hypothetical protein [Acidimicrobiia bacterium]